MPVELILTGVTGGRFTGAGGTFDSPDIIAGDTGIVFGTTGDGRTPLGTPTWDGSVMTVAQKILTNDPNSGNSGIWFIHQPTFGVNDIVCTGGNSYYRAYRMRNCNKKTGATIGDKAGWHVYAGGNAAVALDILDRDLCLACHTNEGGTDFTGEGTEIFQVLAAKDVFGATCDYPQAGNGVANINWDWGGSRDGSIVGAVFLTDPSASNRMIIVMSSIKDKLGILNTDGFKIKNGLFQQEPELVTI
jgi:hypothetical protein